MLDTMYRWCVAAFSSDLWNIPTPVDQVPDGRVVQKTSRSTQCASSDGRSNSIQRRNPGTFCICCVTKHHWEPSVCSRTQITCASGQATTYTTTPSSMATWCPKRVDWRLEWRSVIFTDESRFCLYASDGRTRVRRRPSDRHLPESIRTRHKGPTSGFMVPRAVSYIWCFCRVKSTVPATLHSLLTSRYCHSSTGR